MAVEIVYHTHSLTVDNEKGRATGWLPGRLSEHGRRQAHELGELRRGEPIAAVFVSDLARAVETADLAFGDSGIPVHRDSRLRECDYGELNGMPIARIAAERAKRIDEPYPGGQSYRQVVEQTRDFLRDLAAGWDGRRVVVIGHSANKHALDVLLDGAQLEDLIRAPFSWQEGWEYTVPSGWTGDHAGAIGASKTG